MTAIVSKRAFAIARRWFLPIIIQRLIYLLLPRNKNLLRQANPSFSTAATSVLVAASLLDFSSKEKVGHCSPTLLLALHCYTVIGCGSAIGFLETFLPSSFNTPSMSSALVLSHLPSRLKIHSAFTLPFFFVARMCTVMW